MSTDIEPQITNNTVGTNPKWLDYLIALILAGVIGGLLCTIAGLAIFVSLTVLHPTGDNIILITFAFIALTGLFSFSLYFKRDKSSELLTRALKIVIALWAICLIWILLVCVFPPATDTKTTDVTKMAPYCTKPTPYPMEPKFQRAYSLVKEKDFEMKSELDKIENCLDIKYAKSDAALSGSEGSFSYSPSSNDYLILVSPTFRSDDDYLIALLLTHEVTHALANDVRLRSNVNSSKHTAKENQDYCVGEETMAYSMQMLFVERLNAGERNSLLSTLYLGEATNQLSPEMQVVKMIVDWATRQDLTNPNVMNTEINTWVRAQPYYQKECHL